MRSRPRYISFVLDFADGCSVIHRATYSPTVGDTPRLAGAFHTPRTRSACCRSTQIDASVRVANVTGADTYRPSDPSTRARNRPDGNLSIVPKTLRRRFRAGFCAAIRSSLDMVLPPRERGPRLPPQSHAYSTRCAGKGPNTEC